MAYSCDVRDLHRQPALVVRTRTSVGDLPELMGETFGVVAQYLAQLGECPAGPPFAAYHNEDMQDLDVAIGFPVARELPGRGDIQASETPGGEAATCPHIGPYDRLADAYTALSRWIEEHDYAAKGVSYEMYLNDPSETAQEDLQTQIVFPLEQS